MTTPLRERLLAAAEQPFETTRPPIFERAVVLEPHALVKCALLREAAAREDDIARLERELDEARKALEVIAQGETSVFDEDQGTDVVVPMDETEYQDVALQALERPRK